MAKMKPILFNTEMVRAILEGRKTVTRRVIKPQPTYSPRDGFSYKGRAYGTDLPPTIKGAGYNLRCAAPYKVADVLYVRETWCELSKLDDFEEIIEDTEEYYYRADGSNPTPYNYFIIDGERRDYPKWKPSIHMPKAAARIFLKVTGVRVERLQDMKLTDFFAEGVKNMCDSCNMFPFDKCDTCDREAFTKMCFMALWNSTIKPDQLEYYSWEANPYVWVIEFERIDKLEVAT